MARLIYSMITSLDGCTADREGKFDWAVPDGEVHEFVNGIERQIGTYLFGRRMYEVMRYWESPQAIADQPPFIQEYAAIWRAADKIVYSRTLDSASTARTRMEQDFDPAAVQQLKARAERDISVSGPHLAAQAITAGLVDEYQLFVAPVVVGGGQRSFPDSVHLNLVLLEERRFASGMVHLHYRARS